MNKETEAKLEPTLDNSVEENLSVEQNAETPALENTSTEENTATETSVDFEKENAELKDRIAALENELETYKKKEEENESEESEDEKEDSADDEDEKKNLKNELNNALSKIETYKSQIQEKEAEIVRLNQTNSDINNEKAKLEEFKKAVDTEKKEAIIDEFASHLSEELITEYRDKMDTYSVEDFKKEICFAAYNADSSMLSTKGEEPTLIYKHVSKESDSDVLKLLNKYKGGNK